MKKLLNVLLVSVSLLGVANAADGVSKGYYTIDEQGKYHPTEKAAAWLRKIQKGNYNLSSGQVPK